MIRRLYNWAVGLAEHGHAERALAFVAFIESSVFPIPPDVMLAPMVIVNRARAWRYAAICTAFSVIGGIAGYAIGLFLFGVIGQPILEFYGYQDKFAEFQNLYNDWGWWIVLGAGLTPLPYKVFTIASGVTGMNIIVFTLASLIARGVRFYLITTLLYRFGIPIRFFVEKYLPWVVTVLFLILVAGFILVKYIV